jgi:hypothetical protein
VGNGGTHTVDEIRHLKKHHPIIFNNFMEELLSDEDTNVPSMYRYGNVDFTRVRKDGWLKHTATYYTKDYYQHPERWMPAEFYTDTGGSVFSPGTS